MNFKCAGGWATPCPSLATGLQLSRDVSYYEMKISQWNSRMLLSISCFFLLCALNFKSSPNPRSQICNKIKNWPTFFLFLGLETIGWPDHTLFKSKFIS